jgi:hypothetical protein
MLPIHRFNRDAMNKHDAEHRKTYATPDELQAVLGTNRWALCRNTEKNRDRYGLCLTRKQYAAAASEALNRRAQ